MSETKKRSHHSNSTAAPGHSNDENDPSSGVNSGSESDNAPGGSTSAESSDSESEFDESDVDKRRRKSVQQMLELERQFHDIKESLYTERSQNLETQLRQVKDETASEYTKRLANLQETFRLNDETADVLKEFQLNELKILYECEKSAAFQDYENDKQLLYDRLKEDVETKIAKLKADKYNADVNFEFWQREIRGKTSTSSRHFNSDSSNLKRNSPTPSAGTNEKRRKPVSVTGPYIVYMLKPKDILDDWNVIQRAIMQADLRDKTV